MTESEAFARARKFTDVEREWVKQAADAIWAYHESMMAGETTFTGENACDLLERMLGKRDDKRVHRLLTGAHLIFEERRRAEWAKLGLEERTQLARVLLAGGMTRKAVSANTNISEHGLAGLVDKAC